MQNEGDKGELLKLSLSLISLPLVQSPTKATPIKQTVYQSPLFIVLKNKSICSYLVASHNINFMSSQGTLLRKKSPI
jgi:hypothetical protein